MQYWNCRRGASSHPKVASPHPELAYPIEIKLPHQARTQNRIFGGQAKIWGQFCLAGGDLQTKKGSSSDSHHFPRISDIKSEIMQHFFFLS